MSDAATTPAPPRAPAGKGASRACFKCGKTGHWSKDCTAPREEWIPQRPYGEAGVPQSPTDVGGEGEGDPKPATATKKMRAKTKTKSALPLVLRRTRARTTARAPRSPSMQALTAAQTAAQKVAQRMVMGIAST